MGIDIHTTTRVNAPRSTSFAYVADYRNVPDWLFGINTFTPVGDKDYGLGSVFDGAMSLGVTLKSRIEVDRFVDDELISFDTVKGFKVVSVWTFTEVDGATDITAAVTYTLPFGPAGKAMGKIIEPFVKQAVTHSSAALKAKIEALS